MTLQSVFCNVFENMDNVNFRVIFWDGSVRNFGTGKDFTLRINTREALRKIFMDTSLGFGESYMNGDIEVEGDLREVVRVGLLSGQVDEKTRRSLLNSLMLNILQRNSKRKDRQSISHHYDLGNDFYRLWLDRKMLYSCAYFKNDSLSLEQAQNEKINLCCRKLQLKKDERLLDIGCGWGSLLITAAKNFGIEGVGITLSQEQLAYGKEQIANEGLQDKVHLEYLDYRDLPQLNQSFDKVVSVGMFEHIGKANMKLFLENVQAVLRPTGLLLLHTIGKTVEEPTNNWIRKYIFPGSYLPDLGSILKNCTTLGFNFIDCENMRLHYSKTLDSWSDRFEKNEGKIRSMFDDRFIKMWRFYLAGCSAMFQLGYIHLFQLLFSAGVRNDLPLTREWMHSDTPV